LCRLNLILVLNLDIVPLVFCRMVCHLWNDLLQSPPALDLLMNESKFYLVTPHIHVEGDEDEDVGISEEEEEEEADAYLSLPAGEPNASTIVARAFSQRQICLDILRRYREAWQDLIFLGGDYRPHKRHQKMVESFQRKQDRMMKKEKVVLDPNHTPYTDAMCLDGDPDEQSTIDGALGQCRWGTLAIHLADYGVVVVNEDPPRPKFNILCASGITATSVRCLK